MKYDECPIFKASGQCMEDSPIYGDDCRRCSFKQCLEDMSSDFADDVAEVVVGFLDGERKSKETMSEEKEREEKRKIDKATIKSTLKPLKWKGKRG